MAADALEIPWIIAPIESERDVESMVVLDRLSFSIPWPREMFMRAFDNSTNVRVALSSFRSSGNCAGFVCYTTERTHVEIASVAVASEARRRGLGRKLIGYALTEGFRNGATSASLNVRVSNKGARRFYERLGFVQSRVWHDYYQRPDEDALIYEFRFDYTILSSRRLVVTAEPPMTTNAELKMPLA